VVSETLQLDAAGACLFSYLQKAKPVGYADGLCRACTPMLPPIAPSLGIPFSPIFTIPISIYRVIGMVMIAFVGVATFNKSGKGATSILQIVIWVSPKRQLRNATLAPSCASYASCAAARGAAVGALGSQPVVMIYRIPGIRVALFIEVGRD
jgi:hypothetical protein